MKLPISKLLLNSGQIEGVPKNPRFIKDAEYEHLKKSIQDDPEMLELRELLVYPFNDKYVVLGGNMRLRALKELGYTEADVKVIPKDLPAKKLRAIVQKDNKDYGTNDWDLIANEWDAEELIGWGIDLPSGFLDEENTSEQNVEDDEQLQSIVVVAYENIDDLDKITDFYNLESKDINDTIKNDISRVRKVYVFKS